MQKGDFLPAIADASVPVEERLARLCQFVLYNGIPAPVGLMDPAALPLGHVFRGYLLRDLLLYLAFTSSEAAARPQSAEAASGQLWQLGLEASGDVNPRRSRALCSVNGSVTKVLHLDNPQRCRLLLEEWASTPPTREELSPS